MTNVGANTKIVILKAKELIYTIIFVILGILLLLLLLYMFLPGKKNAKPEDDAAISGESEATETGTYIPGVYTSTVQLGESTLEIQVTVDSEHINDVTITNLNETVTTMYPLLTPALDEIREQLPDLASIDDLKISADSQYTSVILTQAIKNALQQAVPENSAPNNSIQENSIVNNITQDNSVPENAIQKNVIQEDIVTDEVMQENVMQEELLQQERTPEGETPTEQPQETDTPELPIEDSPTA